MEKLADSYVAGGVGRWRSHCRKQFDSFSEGETWDYHTIQQLLLRAHTQESWERDLEEIFAQPC